MFFFEGRNNHKSEANWHGFGLFWEWQSKNILFVPLQCEHWIYIIVQENLTKNFHRCIFLIDKNITPKKTAALNMWFQAMCRPFQFQNFNSSVPFFQYIVCVTVFRILWIFMTFLPFQLCIVNLSVFGIITWWVSKRFMNILQILDAIGWWSRGLGFVISFHNIIPT